MAAGRADRAGGLAVDDDAADPGRGHLGGVARGGVRIARAIGADHEVVDRERRGVDRGGAVAGEPCLGCHAGEFERAGADHPRIELARVEPGGDDRARAGDRQVECLTLSSEEHTSELKSLMRISYAVFIYKKKINRSKALANVNTARQDVLNK